MSKCWIVLSNFRKYLLRVYEMYGIVLGFIWGIR